MRLGPLAASFSTRNRRIAVLFQIPIVPFWTAISEAKMKLQRSDSYQPKERVDHSKRWIRGGEGSMPAGRILGGVSFGVLERSVRIVCRGREGSQESI